MSLASAVNVLKPVNNIVKLTKEVINNMISNKAAFDKANLRSVVKDTIVRLKSSSDVLITAVKSKLPDNIQAVMSSRGPVQISDSSQAPSWPF
jgi:hypothetical protein